LKYTISSTDEDLMVLLLLNNNNNNSNTNNVHQKSKRKYRIHPHLKKNADTLGTFFVVKQLSLLPEKIQIFYRITQKSFEV